MTQTSLQDSRCATAAQSCPAHAARRERDAARAIAEALDEAMERGLWEQAERLAATAARLTIQHPPLAERLARLRLATGESETALMILDGLPITAAPTSQRLLRAIALIKLGRRYESHVELRQWALKAAAPLAARLILAILDWEAGDLEHAMAALMCNLRQIEDPESIIALMLLSAATGNHEQAQLWAQRLRTLIISGAAGPEAEIVLRALGLGGVDVRQEPSAARVQALAHELLANEQVIPALAAAQRIACRRPAARLLRKAIEILLGQVEDQAGAFEALAQLSLALGEWDAAGAWARQGAGRFPLSASLARLAGEFDDLSMPVALERAA